MTTHTLSVPRAEIAYDVLGPLPPADGRPVLVMIGQPMTAEGFHALAGHLDDRTVVLYDPRGLGRSTRSDGLDTSVPETQAGDLHALVGALGGGPVDVLGSSGGAITGLAWVALFPDDVVTLVAHEPPLTTLLPDAARAARAGERVRAAYLERGWGAGMAGFIAMTSWQGEITEEFLTTPLHDPAAFGMPTADDGSRDDPILSDRAAAMTAFRPDAAALSAGPTRVVVGIGEETGEAMTGRTSRALASLLGVEPVGFPGGHGGFGGEDAPWPGQATAFAKVLRAVLET